jgi:hypothetical protein
LYLHSGHSVFSRIYVFSPSVLLDPSWKLVGDFVRNKLKVDTEKEPWAFDTWDPAALSDLLATQRAIVRASRERGLKKMFQILVVIDDFADNPVVSRHDRLLGSLFTRGRHSFVSTVCATQKFRALSNLIRVNAISECVFRLRSEAELLALVEEVSAVMPKKELIELFRKATSEPYSFLYINLAARTPDEMFWQGFEHRILAESSPDHDGSDEEVRVRTRDAGRQVRLSRDARG